VLALLQCRRRFDEDDLVAVLFADAVETNHARAETGRGWREELRWDLGQEGPGGKGVWAMPGRGRFFR